MVARFVILMAGLLTTVPAMGSEMKPEEARRFVAGKLFSYTCFEGTSGTGRIHNDGSVVGTMKPPGAAPARYVQLPAGTLRVKGEAVCASMKGLFFEPCFNLIRTSDRSFRGAISGLGFAYCDFVRRGGRAEIVRASMTSERPSLRPALRPSLTTAGN